MKIIVTKIFYSNPDGSGYQWCIEIESDSGQSIPMRRCATREDAEAWVERKKAKWPDDLVEWHETGHFSLSMAPEYIEGTDPESEAGRDAMNERIEKYMDRREP